MGSQLGFLSKTLIAWNVTDISLNGLARSWSEHPALASSALALVSLFCLSILVTWFSTRSNAFPERSSSRNTEYAAELSALSRALVPTRSFWSLAFIRLLQLPGDLRIPLGLLLEECLSGQLSLRYDESALPLLLGNAMHVEARRVRLDVNAEWKLQVMAWRMLGVDWMKRTSRPASDAVQSTPLREGQPFPSNNISSKDSAALCNAFAFTCSLDGLRDLDIVPNSALKWAIRHSRSCDPSSVLRVEFTARGTLLPATAFSLDPRLVLAALPFLPRTHVTHSAYIHVAHVRPDEDILRRSPHHLGRRSFVLARTLHDVLANLGNVHVLRTEDTSDVRAATLGAYARALESEPEKRAAFVRVWGESGLREEVLYARWEAALFQAGLLARYEITIDKKRHLEY